MAKKLSVQTVAATAKTLEKAASTLAGDEERAIRMRTGVSLAPSDALEQKSGSLDDALAEKLARIELMAFQAMGQKIYGLGKPSTAAAAGPRAQASVSAPQRSSVSQAPMSSGSSPKSKIIKALKRK